MATLADILRQTGYAQNGTLATPAPVESPMTKVLADHIASLPQKTAENIANTNYMVQNAMPYNPQTGQFDTGPTFSEFANYVPNLMGATAWHGTPHKIQGAFDIGKVGTGEGAQAYGHGMYFAENPSVAGEYKRKLSGGLGSASNELTLNGQPLTDLTDAQRRAYEIVARDGRKNALGTAKDLESQGFDASHIREALNATKGKEISLVKNEGNLYKVDIPDEHIPNMLDWDKPLNQQNSEVLKAIKIPQKAADRYNEISNNLEELQWTKGGLDSPEWNKLFEEAKDIKAKYGLHRSGEELYREAYKIAEKAGAVNPSQAAAESLKAQGIPGIRYLDEGSRNKGKGTSNFVVFDPSTVKILEENAKPVSRKALIEEQVKKLKD